MVLLQLSHSQECFIYEVKASESVAVATEIASKLFNLRIRLRSALYHLTELMKDGPAKKLEEQSKEESKQKSDSPTCLREGPSFAPTGDFREVLMKASLEASSTLSADLIKQRKPIGIVDVDGALQNIQSALKIVFPLDLPPHDPLRICVEFSMDSPPLLPFPFPPNAPSFIPLSDSQLWFAGKKMDINEKVGKYCGNNDKSMLKCQLERRSSSHEPLRDRAVDEDTQKKMMAFYYKKEKENKELAEADEDSYLNSEWANPKGYKQKMLGIGDVSFKMK